MDDTNRFALGMEALGEVIGEISLSNSIVKTSTPRYFLKNYLNDIGLLPPEAMFIGACEDGLPALLNLHNSTPQALGIFGDDGTGKTEILKVIAEAIKETHAQEQVVFAVLTNNPKEWEGFDRYVNCIGIFPMYATSSGDVVLSLASWAHANIASKQSVVMLVDDLGEFIRTADFDTKQNFKWLLLRGAARRCWTVSTVRTSDFLELETYTEHIKSYLVTRISKQESLDYFLRTRDIENRKSRVWKNHPMGWEESNLTIGELYSPDSFFMIEGENWTKCYIPSLENYNV